MGGGNAGQAALELGHYIAGQQFVGAVQAVPGRPVLHADQQAAEAAGQFLQFVDAPDAVVGGADDPLFVVGHKVHDLVAGDVGDFVAEGIAEVFGYHAGGAGADVLFGLLLAFGQVDAYGEAPFGAFDGLAVFGGGFLGDGPLVFEAGGAHHIAGDAEGDDAGAVFAGGGYAGGGLDGCHHQGEGLLPGAQLEVGIVQFKPVAAVGVGFGAVHKAFDDAQGFVHHFALAGGVDAEHIGVGGEGAGADAEHHAAAGEVVEQHHAVGDHIGVVVGEADHAGAEAEGAGALGGGSHKDFGGGDGFPAGAVVFADPGFVVAQVVEPLQEFQVAFQGEGGVFADAVEGGHKDAELHAGGGGGHSVVSLVWLARGGDGVILA